MKLVIATLVAMSFVTTVASAAGKRTPAESKCDSIQNALGTLEAKADMHLAKQHYARAEFLDLIGELVEITLDGCEHLRDFKNKIKDKFAKECNEEIADQKADVAKAEKSTKFYSFGCSSTNTAPGCSPEALAESNASLKRAKVANQKLQLEFFELVCKKVADGSNSR